jgi:kynureninase
MTQETHEAFDRSRERAKEHDAADSLAGFRDRFHLPRAEDGEPRVYLTGNSLGLQPVEAEGYIRQELDAWARLGVEAHFGRDSAWYAYHALLTEPLARLVGASNEEVVAMNSLSVNLHLMMVSFYRPQEKRRKILMEDCAFPSDTYAVRTQIEHHGLDPDECLLVARGESPDGCDDSDLERMIDEH